MKTVYDKAPVYLIEGTPGYLAGEWPGLKSNKFSNTRRIIRQYSSGIIFDRTIILNNNNHHSNRDASNQHSLFNSTRVIKGILIQTIN